MSDIQSYISRIVELSDDLYCVAGIDGYFKSLSDNWVQTLGFELDELMSKPYINFIHPEDLEPTIKEASKLSQGQKTVDFVNRYIAKNGVHKYLSWRSRLDPETGHILCTVRDVTRRIDETNLFLQTQRAANIGTWWVDVDNGICHWNPKTYEIHEIDPSVSIKLEDGINFYAPEHRDQIQNAVELGIKNSSSWDVELKIITGTGREKWVRAFGYPVLNDGKLVRLEGTFQDIHSQKIEELELRKTRQRLEMCLEASNLGIWDWNMETNTVFFDDRWGAMIGYDSSEIVHNFSFFQDSLHPQDSAQVYQKIDAYMSGASSAYQVKFRLRHKDGRWIHIFAAGRFSAWNKDGKPIQFTGTHLDITEIERSRELLRQAQQVANLGSWQFDLGTRKFIWSEQMFSLFSVDSSGSSPSFDDHLAQIHAEDRRSWEDAFSEALQSGRDFSIKFRVNLVNVSVERWIEAIGKCVLEDSKVVGISGTYQDVSQRVMLERELEIERANFIQSAKLASLGEMAAGLAHEINNPLAIVSGNLQILAKVRGDQLKFEDKINRSMRATERISKIVLGLRKFSRTSDRSKRSLIDIKSLINEAKDMIEIKAKDHSVKIEIEGQDIKVFCAEIELGQVFINLFSNAVDAVKLLSDRWIKVSVNRVESYAEIRVCDSGHGIKAEVIDKIFNPFFTTKEIGSGTGLGLSISKGIIEDHQGFLSIDQGSLNTCFVVKLPIARDQNHGA